MRGFKLLPRNKRAQKSHYGHVLVVAGSIRMPGAAILTARAVLKSGAGLLTLATTRSLSGRAMRSVVEGIHLGLPETKTGSVSAKSLNLLLKTIQKRRIQALVLGPGMSTDVSTFRLIRALVQKVNIPIVLDADGINAFEARPKDLSQCPNRLVLTPHDGEFRRLFSYSCPEKSRDRIALAKKMARLYHVVLVLKGYRTIVTDGQKLYVNRTGNPGMAKGGSGDVLAGVVAAFLAQGLSGFEAAKWAAYFHGLSADLAVKKTTQLSLLASDIIDGLPAAFRHG